MRRQGNECACRQEIGCTNQACTVPMGDLRGANEPTHFSRRSALTVYNESACNIGTSCRVAGPRYGCMVPRLWSQGAFQYHLIN